MGPYALAYNIIITRKMPFDKHVSLKKQKRLESIHFTKLLKSRPEALTAFRKS